MDADPTAALEAVLDTKTLAAFQHAKRRIELATKVRVYAWFSAMILLGFGSVSWYVLGQVGIAAEVYAIGILFIAFFEWVSMSGQAKGAKEILDIQKEAQTTMMGALLDDDAEEADAPRAGVA